jgi:aminopeptidase N
MQPIQQLQPKTIYRKDYKAPEFTIAQVHLDFHIHSETEVIIVNTMTLQRLTKGSISPLVLDGQEMELQEVTLDGKKLTPQDYTVTPQSLEIPNVADAFNIIIKNKINPKANTLLSGLYFADGLFCTQCESEGFRRITYFLDRPDVLTTFTVKIHADRKKYPVLLSNGNCIAKDEGSATWEDPFKKPSYLFACVIGDLACVKDYFMTMSGRRVELRIYVDHGNEDKCHHAMESLKHSMEWDEKVFGREYDLNIYMIVAVRSFNMGAMENKGLNVFNAKYVLGLPESATDADFIGIERVIGHEYFHNWTGNRVTCRDWFQLSLKEGLTVFRDQEFTHDMQESGVCRIQDVKTLRSHQFNEDAGPMAHPVRPESYIEINNFYTATVYNKGAEVIRMQHTLLGKDGFRKGMDLYFQRHDGQAVTIDDFVKAMEDANDKDLTQFKRWYSQSGTPEITASTHYDENQQTFSLILSQFCPPTPGQAEKEQFHIPIRIALWDSQQKPIEIKEKVLELKEHQQTWTWKNIPSKPIVSLLGNFSAPVKLKIDYTDEELQTLVNAETDDFSRWEALQRVSYGYLVQRIESAKHSKNLPLPEFMVNIYRNILQHSLINPLLKGELLTLPTFLEFNQYLGYTDVDAMEEARDYLHIALGKALLDDFYAIYQSLNEKSTSAMTAHAYGDRKLKNSCLTYLVYAKHPEARVLAFNQLTQAKNMADELAAFWALMYFDDETRDKAAEIFYNKWKEDDLVLDKWFTTQAISPLPTTLEHVKKLTTHPKFDRKNPNKIRALLSSFWMLNPRNFHAIDGSAYEFFVSEILAFDKDNAFVSASLVRSLINWKTFDEKRKKLMQNALKTILKEPNISKDLYEIVSKSVS